MKRIDFEKIGKAIYPEAKERFIKGKGPYYTIDRNYTKRKVFTEGLEHGYNMFRSAVYKLLALIILILVAVVLIFILSFLTFK